MFLISASVARTEAREDCCNPMAINDALKSSIDYLDSFMLSLLVDIGRQWNQ